MSCPGCDRDLTYPGQPGHECYTYEEQAESQRRHAAYNEADLAQSEALLDLAEPWMLDHEEDGNGEPTLWLLKGGGDPLPMPVLSLTDLHPDMRHLWPLLVNRVLKGNKPNSQWYTEAAVEEIRRDYEVQIAGLRRLLALRTDAMHRVIEKNEMLRAERSVN